jgi:death-on-curing protein
MSWVWLSKAGVTAFHAEQIAEHGGGGTALRDEGLLESALARPGNMAAYESPDVFDLAAAYAFDIAKNHPFVDGNKRAAFIAAATFLILNGRRLQSSEADAVLQTLALASNSLDEQGFADWLRRNSKKI